jgi:hypothetical protein
MHLEQRQCSTHVTNLGWFDRTVTIYYQSPNRPPVAILPTTCPTSRKLRQSLKLVAYMVRYMPVRVVEYTSDDEDCLHDKPHQDLNYYLENRSREKGSRWTRRECSLAVALFIQTLGMCILVTFLLKSGSKCFSPSEDLTGTSLLWKYGQTSYCEF